VPINKHRHQISPEKLYTELKNLNDKRKSGKRDVNFHAKKTKENWQGERIPEKLTLKL